MEINYLQAGWQLTYDDGRAGLPQALSVDDAPLCGDLRNAIDGVTDAHARAQKTHHYRRWGRRRDRDGRWSLRCYCHVLQEYRDQTT